MKDLQRPPHRFTAENKVTRWTTHLFDFIPNSYDRAKTGHLQGEEDDDVDQVIFEQTATWEHPLSDLAFLNP